MRDGQTSSKQVNQVPGALCGHPVVLELFCAMTCGCLQSVLCWTRPIPGLPFTWGGHDTRTASAPSTMLMLTREAVRCEHRAVPLAGPVLSHLLCSVVTTGSFLPRVMWWGPTYNMVYRSPGGHHDVSCCCKNPLPFWSLGEGLHLFSGEEKTREQVVLLPRMGAELNQ